MQRIDYIDTAKGIGIILVFIGHCGLKHDSPLFLWIYSFHMPLFFFISGLLLKNSKLGGGVKRKTISLIVPYTVFSIFNWGMFKLTNNSIGIGWILYGWGRNPLWFIPILYSIEILYYGIISSNKLLKSLSVLIITALLVYKTTTNGWLPYCVSEIPWFFLCFISGVLLKDTILHYEPYFSTGTSITTLIIHAIFLFCIVLPYNINYRQQDNDVVSYLFRYIAGMTGTFGCLIASKVLSEYRGIPPIKWLGRNSIVILCTHYTFLHCLNIDNHTVVILLSFILSVCCIPLYNNTILKLINRLKTI